MRSLALQLEPATRGTTWADNGPDLPERPDWHQHGLCVTDSDHQAPAARVDRYFPTRGRWDRLAYAECFDCPVRAECADAGMTELYGTWGGLAERARRRIRLRWRREVQGIEDPAERGRIAIRLAEETR